MGNNGAYTIMEATVVGLFDIVRLDAEILRVVLEAYKGMDIDSGGSMDLKSQFNDYNVEEIIVLTWRGRIAWVPEDAKGHKKPRRDFTEKEYDEYWEKLHKEFREITRTEFGWG